MNQMSKGRKMGSGTKEVARIFDQLIPTVICLLLPSICNSQLNPSEDGTSKGLRFNAQNALRSITREFLIKEADSLQIFIYPQTNYTRMEIKDLLSDWLTIEKVAPLPVEIRYTNIYLRNFNVYSHTIIFVDSSQPLRSLNPFRLKKHAEHIEYYLVFLILEDHETLEESFRNIFEYFWTHHITNVNILYEFNSTLLEMVTFFPFADENWCRSLFIKSINEFDGSWKYPLASTIYPNKMADFNGCTLKVAVFHVPPFLGLTLSNKLIEEIQGFEADLLWEMTDILNFTVELIIPEDGEDRGRIFANRTTTGAIYMRIFALSCLLVAASAALVPQSQHRSTRDVSELEAPTNDYLPPENNLEATSEVITEAPSVKSLDTDSSAALGDKGYEYRSIRRLKYRLRNRRDVSHLVPSNHYLPPNQEYLPPTPESQPENDSEETISTEEVAPKVSNEYLPPGEEPEVAPETSSEEVPEEMTTLPADSEIVEAASLKSVDGPDAEDSEVVDIPVEEVAQDTAILAEDGYHYKRPEESSMLKMVSPVGEYLPPVVEEVVEAVGPEETALLADDGYYYRVVRRFRF